MPQAIYLFITYILSAFTYLIPTCHFLPFRLRPRQKMTLYCILLIDIVLIGSLLGNIGAVLLLISCCLYLSIINEKRLLNTGIFLGTYLSCVLGDTIFSLLWDAFIFPISSLQDTYGPYILYVACYTLLLALVCPGLARLIHYMIRKLHAALSKQLIILITTDLAICSFIFLSNIVIGEHIGYDRSIITFNCILFGCYFLINTILIVNVIRAHQYKVDMEMRQESFEQLQGYAKQIENMYSSLRSFKHDHLNIMLSMSGYIETGDIEGLRNYFDHEILPLDKKLSIDTSHFDRLMNIKITGLKSIISAKLSYAIEMGINVSIEVTDEIQTIPVDTIDLSRILGIFLDNAIEATLETEDPAIQFAMIDLENEYAIIVENTFWDSGIPYAVLRRPGFSTKGSDRGIGLHNAHELIARYGDVFWDTETKDAHFIQRLRILK